MFTREYCIIYATEFVEKLRIKGIDIKIAMIFGSYSKGNSNENSDLDLLLVSDSFKGVGFIDSIMFADELIDYDKIQVKTYSYKDYLERDPFIEEIEKNAIALN